MDIEIKTESPKIRAKLPQHYHQIYTSYTSQNYEKCLEIIAEVVGESHIEYSILKSACLIHLGKDISLAHEILDNILDQHPNNSYTVYAKGLAFYHEEKWKEAANYFDRAREIDPSPDLERAEIMKNKAMQKIAEEQEPKLLASASFKSSPQDTGYSPARRFGCEICGHFFGKKFNLDRHNRSIHRRNTPGDFPQNSPAVEEAEEPSSLKSEPIVDSAVSVTFIDPELAKDPVPKKNRSKQPTSLNLFGSKNRAKCPHCKKLFKRGSLARHMIIHTGKKHHECSTCHRSFFQKSDLLRHETIHSDVLAFECELCSKKFRLKKNMQVHKRRHHQ